MVGCVTGKGIPTPFQGLVYSSGYGVRDKRRGTRGGGGEANVTGDTPTPETGLGYPFSCHASYHGMAGYAYVNPLAG